MGMTPPATGDENWRHQSETGLSLLLSNSSQQGYLVTKWLTHWPRNLEVAPLDNTDFSFSSGCV